jgi:hypothetical protein
MTREELQEDFELETKIIPELFPEKFSEWLMDKLIEMTNRAEISERLSIKINE